MLCACRAYEEATSWSNSEDGDDLPGLLCNWGTGLLAMAEVAGGWGDSGADQAGDSEERAVALLQDAVSRLNASLDFNRGDIQVCVWMD